MNKIKLLLLAGLFSLASMAQAITLDPTADGDLYIGATGDQADGAFGGVTGGGLDSVFYNLHINSQGFAGAAGTGQDVVFTSGGLVYSDEAVAINIFQDDGDGVFNSALDSLIAFSAAKIDNYVQVFLSNANSYYFELIGNQATSYSVAVAAVPVPAAGILFASALLGAGALGRRKKKVKASVVGAFTRAS